MLNVSKMKFMLFSPRDYLLHTCHVKLLVNGLVIEQVKNFKFLVLWIDHYLAWEYHVQALLSKLSQNKVAMRKTGFVNPSNYLRTL